MAKGANIIDEIAAAIPPSQSRWPWWKRLDPDHQKTIDVIHAAWLAGKFGTRKSPAAQAISAWLTGHGIPIGKQGVIAWLSEKK
jgi:hypothetical protein